MGLDITAYKNVTLIEVVSGVEEYEEKYPDSDRYDFTYINDDFPGRNEPIVHHGVYEVGDKFGLRAGSYSGYNQWRAELSQVALGVMPQMVWHNFDKFAGLPFVELIHFSDCEGILGTVVSKKLLKDFQDYQEEADSHPDRWFAQKYNDWRKAFEYAAENGYVDFH